MCTYSVLLDDGMTWLPSWSRRSRLASGSQSTCKIFKYWTNVWHYLLKGLSSTSSCFHFYPVVFRKLPLPQKKKLKYFFNWDLSHQQKKVFINSQVSDSRPSIIRCMYIHLANPMYNPDDGRESVSLGMNKKTFRCWDIFHLKNETTQQQSNTGFLKDFLEIFINFLESWILSILSVFLVSVVVSAILNKTHSGVQKKWVPLHREPRSEVCFGHRKT